MYFHSLYVKGNKKKERIESKIESHGLSPKDSYFMTSVDISPFSFC